MKRRLSSAKRLPTLVSGMVGATDLVRALPSIAGNAPALLGARPRWPSPTFVRWVLTERCPLRCLHCDMGQPGVELDHQGRLEVAHRLGRSRIWGVSLIGGEVATVKHLAQYAALLRARRKFVLIGLSGLAIERHLQGLIDADVDALVFSIDGASAESHDAFRGHPGLYEKVERAVAQVRALPGRRPRVQVRYTINRRNLDETAAFIEAWRGRVDNLILQIIQSNGLHTVRAAEQVMFQAADRPALEAVLDRVARRFPELADRSLRQMADYAIDTEGLRRELGFRCALVPSTQLVVGVDGGVTICNGRPDSAVGSVLDSELESIWQSAQTAATRRRMQSKDYGCMCWEAASAGNLELVAAERAARRLLAGGRGPG